MTVTMNYTWIETKVKEILSITSDLGFFEACKKVSKTNKLFWSQIRIKNRYNRIKSDLKEINLLQKQLSKAFDKQESLQREIRELNQKINDIKKAHITLALSNRLNGHKRRLLTVQCELERVDLLREKLSDKLSNYN